MTPDGSALQHASTGALVGFAVAMGAPGASCRHDQLVSVAAARSSA
jgi:hypothetical protein